MAVNETTLALIGAGGVVLGALVGGISGWGSAVIAGRRSQRDARETRRREAYTAILIAFNQFGRHTLKSHDYTDPEEIRSLSALIDEAMDPIIAAYVAITLTGSSKAGDAASELLTSLMDLNEILHNKPEKDREKSFESAFKALAVKNGKFLAVARDEFS